MPSTLILIIDSEQTDHATLREQMLGEPYQLMSAYTGDEGVALAIEHAPNLILLDALMPDKSGYEICQTLSNMPATADIPILMLTKLRDVSYRIRAIESGADELLTQPNNQEELLVRVRSQLKLQQARQQLQTERDNFRLLYDVNRVTLQQIELDDLIRAIIRQTQHALKAGHGVLIVTDAKGRPIRRIISSVKDGVQAIQSRVDQKIMSQGFAGWIWHRREGDIISDVAVDARWLHLETSPLTGSAIGVPLIYAGQTVYGVMVFSHYQPHFFEANHLKLLMMIANQVTAALHNAQLYGNVRDEQHKLATILTQTTDAIIVTDPNKRIELFNEAAEIMFDTTMSSVTGELIENAPVLSTIAPFFDNTTPMIEECTLDDERILSVSMSPIPDVGMVTVIQDITEQRRREQARYQALEDTFRPYFGSNLYEYAIADIQARHTAVVLFADLRNHTQLVSACAADQVIAYLNEFFDEMTQIIHRHDGAIIDLIGDELEVCFNVHKEQPDAAERAMRAAIEMQKRFNELRPTWQARSGIELGLGIGIDMGEVVIGQVGSHSRKNLALVGQAVNTAHRMVDIAQDGYIVVTENIYPHIIQISREHQVSFYSIGQRPIKGLAHPLGVLLAKLKPL